MIGIRAIDVARIVARAEFHLVEEAPGDLLSGGFAFAYRLVRGLRGRAGLLEHEAHPQPASRRLVDVERTCVAHEIAELAIAVGAGIEVCGDTRQPLTQYAQ